MADDYVSFHVNLMDAFAIDQTNFFEILDGVATVSVTVTDINGVTITGLQSVVDGPFFGHYTFSVDEGFLPPGWTVGQPVWLNVALNGDEGPSGSDFTERSINTQAANYICDITDEHTCIKFTKATAGTITIPPQTDEAWAAETVLSGIQYGAGQITITPGSGVTLRSAYGLKTVAQYAVWEARRITTDEWVVYGALTA